MPSSCPLCRSEFDTLNERRDNILGQLPTGKLSVIKYSAVHLIVPLMIGFNAGFYKKILIVLHFLSWHAYSRRVYPLICLIIERPKMFH